MDDLNLKMHYIVLNWKSFHSSPADLSYIRQQIAWLIVPRLKVFNLLDRKGKKRKKNNNLDEIFKINDSQYNLTICIKQGVSRMKPLWCFGRFKELITSFLCDWAEEYMRLYSLNESKKKNGKFSDPYRNTKGRIEITIKLINTLGD